MRLDPLPLYPVNSWKNPEIAEETRMQNSDNHIVFNGNRHDGDQVCSQGASKCI